MYCWQPVSDNVLLSDVAAFFHLSDKASLALFTNSKQKYQNGNIHRKIRVPTSEREGKLSNPRARRARDAWRKFTEIYGNPRARAARALCIDFLPLIGTVLSATTLYHGEADAACG
jgi:hypothetical protein